MSEQEGAAVRGLVYGLLIAVPVWLIIMGAATWLFGVLT